ncbi:MAG: alginate export family protein [Planctomycetota bacterium]|nr:alginate export family protein [Planctomycetota bacterium]
MDLRYRTTKLALGLVVFLASRAICQDDLPPVPDVGELAFDEAAVDAEESPLGIPPAVPLETPDPDVPDANPQEPASADTQAAPAVQAKPGNAPPKGAKKPAKPQFPGPKTLPPTGPYKVLFFNNDFSYKKDPEHDYIFGEELKDMSFDLFGQPLQVSTGGEIRYRFMNEDNRLRPGKPLHADYNLWRWRHYVDTKWGDFRVYGELLTADAFDSEGPDQPIDVNRWDIQNLFFDWMFWEGELGKHTFRYGREEYLLGRQRLVSPLDWANIRRNFQGYHYMLKGDNFTFDAFAVNPVNAATGYVTAADYDSGHDTANHNVWFGGTYYSYTGWKNTVVDAYWLSLNTNSQSIPRPELHRNTFGSRWAHLSPITDGAGTDVRVWDFDVEGGVQAGAEKSRDVIAGFFTGIVGHSWKKPAWAPRVAGLFYYGSGTTDATGSNNTFNVMFPLNHAYWAISDNLVGQNLFDYSLQLDVKPTKKTAMTSAFHWFQLASAADTAYNVAGVPVGKPGNGKDVGTALDLYGYYAFNPNFDIQMGYSWFWYGSYIERTAPRDDATQLYIQTSLRY